MTACVVYGSGRTGISMHCIDESDYLKCLAYTGSNDFRKLKHSVSMTAEF